MRRQAQEMYQSLFEFFYKFEKGTAVAVHTGSASAAQHNDHLYFSAHPRDGAAREAYWQV